MNLAVIRCRLLESNVYLAALLMLAIYVSTSLAVILSSVVCLLWLLTGEFKQLPALVNRNPVAASALFLWLCFVLGLSYTPVSYDVAWSMVMKYRELLFIPIFMALLATARARAWVWLAFVVASLVILGISFLMEVGVLALNKHGAPSFKSHITHSIFISFFAFYCAHKAYDSGRYAKLYAAGLLISVYNLFFVVDGRTGQLTVLLLAVLFGVQRLTKKMLMIGMLVLAVLFGLFLGFSDKAVRIHEGLASTQAYWGKHPEKSEFSMGERFTFWRYSSKLIAEKPLFGHGTGSYVHEYERVGRSEHVTSNNPHNEFLMVTVQLGALGLCVYLGFLGSQWYLAKQLPKPEQYLAQGVLLTLLVTSLFNSPLMDHAEGHWFALMIALCFATAQTKHKEAVNA